MTIRLSGLLAMAPAAMSQAARARADRPALALFWVPVLMLVMAVLPAIADTTPTAGQRERLARFALADQQPSRALYWLGAADSAGADYSRARAWLQTGRKNEAIKTFVTIADAGKAYGGDAALALVKLALDADDEAAARRHIDTAVNLSSGQRKQEALFYRADLQRRAGQTDQAGRTLSRMDGGYWAALGYLNLAADYSRTDRDPSRALVSLRVAQALAAEDTNPDRARDLTNRILLRAGVLSCQSEDYTKALGFLEKVTLDSYLAPQALYFDGLAHAGRDNYRAAMQAWHRARKYSLAFPGAADAWLGMGRGYDESGYLGQAGEAYLAASSAFESEQVSLKTLMDNVRRDGAYSALVTSARQDDVEWFLADSRTLTQPRMAYLLHFMEQPQAQKAVGRVAYLDTLARSLDRRQHDVGIFLKTLADFRQPGKSLDHELSDFDRQLTVVSARLQSLSDRASSGSPAAARLSRLRETLDRLQARRETLAQKSQRGSPGTQHELSRQLETVQTGLVRQQKRLIALRRRAETQLDKLTLDFLQGQSRQIADTLDRTEQQIAHLYEHLALTGLKQGGQP